MPLLSADKHCLPRPILTSIIRLDSMPQPVRPSLVEIEICVGLLDIGLIALVKVLGQDDVAVLAHCMHASLLADCRDLSIADLVWPRHIILQVHLLAQVHAGSACLCTSARPRGHEELVRRGFQQLVQARRSLG